MPDNLPVPDRTETWTDAQAQQRLQQLRARYNQEKSTADRQVYFTHFGDHWITVQRDGTNLRFDYYKDCPC